MTARLSENAAADMPRQRRRPPLPQERLASFLERRQAAVVDVVPGALPGSRRLLVGEPGPGMVSHAVAVGHSARTGAAVDNEQRVLTGIGDVVAPEVRRTVPRVVERVVVDSSLSGLVVTAVTGLRGAAPGGARGPKRLLAASGAWLSEVWQESAGPITPVDLGREATHTLATRFPESVQLAPTLRSAQRARGRLELAEVRSTLTHGCLCPRHVFTGDGCVTGVDDWGLGSLAGDPTRDLGGLAVRVADGRLEEVVGGRTAYAGMLRDFVGDGLARVGLPAGLWRDVLLLSQLELAVCALQRGDPSAIALLMTTVRALPAERERNETRRP